MTPACRLLRYALPALITAFCLAGPVHAELPAPQGEKSMPEKTRTEDMVYGCRDGHAMTMDVFTPTRANGAAVVVFVSIGYRSGREYIDFLHPLGTRPFLDRGYTVFAVLVSSQPKYTVPEIVEDAHRAVRFVKHHGKRFGIDPAKVGVTGASAGGHLALMTGYAGGAGDPEATDPVARASSKATAVACFFPPSDFAALEGNCSKEFAPAFDFREATVKTGLIERVSLERRRQIGADVSPLTHVAKGSAPTLIVHGDRDTLVPLSQSERTIDKLKGCGVPCELIVKAGKGHGWLGIEKDVPSLADWFDTHLLGRGAVAAVPHAAIRQGSASLPVTGW